jgi:hypothetical protein
MNIITANAFGLNLVKLEELENAREKYEPIIINSTIPLVDYGYLNGEYIGPQLNPITIAQSAMRDYAEIQQHNYTNETKILELIIKADWFLGHSRDIGNYSILEYNFDFPPTQMKAPWVSGMAQAQAMQALIKAHNITNDNRYLNLTDRLLNSFFVEVKDGGVTYKDNDGWWYEEYPNPNTSLERRVLNGMGFTLLGLYDYYLYTGNSVAKYLFDKGMISLIENLDKYDDDPYSLYDLSGKPADRYYHLIHLEVLEKLYKITNEPILKEYFEKWKSKI